MADKVCFVASKQFSNTATIKGFPSQIVKTVSYKANGEQHPLLVKRKMTYDDEAISWALNRKNSSFDWPSFLCDKTYDIEKIDK